MLLSVNAFAQARTQLGFEGEGVDLVVPVRLHACHLASCHPLVARGGLSAAPNKCRLLVGFSRCPETKVRARFWLLVRSHLVESSPGNDVSLSTAKNAAVLVHITRPTQACSAEFLSRPQEEVEQGQVGLFWACVQAHVFQLVCKLECGVLGTARCLRTSAAVNMCL
jgi:hypothetical protein